MRYASDETALRRARNLVSAALLVTTACAATETAGSPDTGVDAAGRDAPVETGPEAPCDPIDRRFPGPCVETAISGDGTPTVSRRFGYDSAGRTTLARDELDDREERWTYDPAGELLTYAESARGTVRVAMTCTHVYDRDRLVDSVCDGGPGGPDGQPETATHRTYDATGRPLTVESDGEPPFEPPDGAPDSIRRFEYDGAGRQTVDAQDFDANGVDDRRLSWVRDGDGRVTEERLDRDADGDAETIHIWTYDTAGHLMAERVDDDGDGVWDKERTYTLDVEGRPMAERYTFAGPFGDTVSVDTAHEYRSDGQLSRSIATWSDGSSSTAVWFYDADGRPRRREEESQGVFGGDLDTGPQRSTEDFDCAGNRVAESFDRGADGSVDSGLLYTFDDACYPR